MGLAILLACVVAWFGTGLLGARMIVRHPALRFAEPGQLDPALVVTAFFGPIGLAAAWTVLHSADA